MAKNGGGGGDGEDGGGEVRKQKRVRRLVRGVEVGDADRRAVQGKLGPVG